ncbi:FadR/GntR family transcriptional regulator [Inquilinus sp. NPDC058860]|uniref:FadR/GntR family transcriptional regulator n=1 Tax=Inquilinus sp. NPDC058860 TaxID=3346652 RepID=UPI0036BD68C3
MTLDMVVPNTNLVSSLSAALEREILSGRFKAGDRLPTESELSRTTGVSRTVVREAVAALRASGLVETRRGSGAFVAAQPPRIGPAILRATLDDILSVLELRLAVEVEAAALAAARHRDEDIRALSVALEEGEAAGDGRRLVTADLAFHKAIAAATQNKYFVDFINHLGEFAFPRRHLDPSAASAYGLSDYQGRIEAEHRAILEAIRQRDSALASAEMRRHLAGSRARYKAMTGE